MFILFCLFLSAIVRYPPSFTTLFFPLTYPFEHPSVNVVHHLQMMRARICTLHEATSRYFCSCHALALRASASTYSATASQQNNTLQNGVEKFLNHCIDINIFIYQLFYQTFIFSLNVLN